MNFHKYEVAANINNYTNYIDFASYDEFMFIKKWKPKNIKEKEYNKTVPNVLFKRVEKISGIMDKEELKKYVESLIIGSFGINIKFKLTFPYYSKNDEDYYSMPNPLLKEKVFKIPMIRGSGWKGVFLKSALSRLKKFVDEDDEEGALNLYIQCARLFGTGSDEIRKLKKSFELHCDNKDNNFIEKLTNYMIFQLGIPVKLNRKENETLIRQLTTQILDKSKCNYCNSILDARKGRLIFYPTYFKKIGYEVLNPINRVTKHGSGVIGYEVVPKYQEGTFELLYIPFDIMEDSVDNILSESKEDLKLIKKLIKISIEEVGIGGKRKLGWGKGKIIDDFESSIFVHEGRK